ncbi:carboxypeptidase D [Malassezia caprae]|uniref:Carboxypeptidase n=1 Tax=Malassezia caprae TaxID=1381934 RepID=A0AAF0EB89_9BASI|nr:carboxypeptidase D [Malassezia caprae]
MSTTPPGWGGAVVGLPGLEWGTLPSFDMDAGYMPVRALDSATGAPKDFAHVYYWRHSAMWPQRRRKVILWLNGGPGCSSLDGALMELGPFRFQSNGTLAGVARGIAWNEYADVVYVDQPVGTGFSIVDNDAFAQSLQQVADEMVAFLRGLVQRYPEYARDDTDVYLAGESYAGQYIPYVAKTLRAMPDAPLALRGVIIGNGFIDPRTQYGTSVETMQQAGLWQAQGPELQHMAPFLQQCRDAMKKDAVARAEYPECEAVALEVERLTLTSAPDGERCINMFDLRLNDTAPACGMNWPPEVHAMSAYLRRTDVRGALHVDGRLQPEAWVECNGRVGRVLRAAAQTEEASVRYLPALLEHGLRVLLFAGDRDLVCSALGHQRLVDALTWHGQTGMGAHARPAPYLVNEAPVGTWIEARNLTLATFYNASHMAPYDVPYAAHDMMLRFVGAERSWPSGAVPSVRTRIGNSEAWLVAAPAQAPAQASAQAPAAAPTSLPREWVWLGLLLLGVALCLYRRRRARRVPSGGYYAVGQHIVDEPRIRARDLEMQTFVLEDEGD